MARVAGGGPSLPEDLIVWEILTRLPAKPLLRCRAVCRSWHRRLTSDAEFLLAHHRRQPSLPLLTKEDRTAGETRIDALDHPTGEGRPVTRKTGRTTADEDGLDVLASCDGLLVLQSTGGFVICNPATRQRAPLTLLHGAAAISGLYAHRPSGSYRVLCCFRRAQDGHLVYHVHTVGSRELRCVGEPPAPWASGALAKMMPTMVRFHPHVVADGRIYWQSLGTLVNIVIAFDTMAESFQKLPVKGPRLELFQMNSGALGFYHYGISGGTADLWVLQDHRSWSWSMNHPIKLPRLVCSLLPVLDPEGDVLVVSYEGRSTIMQHISGANGSLMARYEWSNDLQLSSHRYTESLVHHDFFSMEGNAGGDVVEKPFFDGLSTVAVPRDDNSEPH